MDVYLIFYEIQKEQIEIVSFWDNRQDKFWWFDDLMLR
jgi:hypothetical protein